MVLVVQYLFLPSANVAIFVKVWMELGTDGNKRKMVIS